ncbi:MAG: LytTR family transcriptional regulator DNA-binding domain-containing protein [Ruminococcus sp.]|nr:LytTR family transcriptional regulator DNA-binding domain-containing protein [Ruminococcus sp.]
MISLLSYSSVKNELKIIKSKLFEIISRNSEEDCDYKEFIDDKSIRIFLESKPVVDISCLDVTTGGGTEIAECVRQNSNNTYIVLIADNSVSPTKYIKPSIMAGSLLIRPFDAYSVYTVFSEAVSAYLKYFDNEDGENCFVIDNRDGRQLVPYSQILYFESRNKKIYLVTDNQEYSFYDTLDNIQEKLNQKFIRCHRSFIISKSRIEKIVFSQNYILLENNYNVPISRTYRSALKELK